MKNKVYLILALLFLLDCILAALVFAQWTKEEPTPPAPATEQQPAEAIKTTFIAPPEPEAEPAATMDYPGLYDDAIYAAKTIYGEGSYLQPMEKAAIVWCACNRVESANPFYPDTFAEVITQPMQFQGYRPDNPVTEENLALALDVLTRWEMEKAGAEDVGRVLPADYLFFMGDLKHNYYTKEYQGSDYWDWSLPNPYEEVR